MEPFDPKRLLILPDVELPHLNSTRTVRIYLPYDYKEGHKDYPVLYMHDGQNVFDDQTATYGMSWKAGDILDDLQVRGITQGLIIVAIDCSNGLCRYNEYSPWKMDPDFELPSRSDDIYRYGGDGDKYGAFLIETLKPYIDANFRTCPERETTYLAGSSMGGLITLYLGSEYSNVFAKLGILSPAFWFNKNQVFNHIQQQEFKRPTQIYMDMGTSETGDPLRADFSDIYLSGSREMKAVLDKKHNVALFYQEGAGHVHNELAWRMRFPDMIRFFYS